MKEAEGGAGRLHFHVFTFLRNATHACKHATHAFMQLHYNIILHN